MSLNWATKNFQWLTFNHRIKRPKFKKSTHKILIIQLTMAIDPMIKFVFIIPMKFWAMLKILFINFWSPSIADMCDQKY